MKKIMMYTLCALLLLSLAACGGKSAPQPAPSGENVQIPNPFTDCDTLEDAAKLAGFGLTAPDAVDGFPGRSIQVMNGSQPMIQVYYGDGALCVRKAIADSESADISGDYTTYDTQDTLTVDGLDVAVRGGGDLLNVAIWTSGGCAFSIQTNDGLDAETMTALIRSVA